jgi:gluconolactonase
VDVELLAEGLGWPEGPARLPDGSFVFVESYRSRLTVWSAADGIQEYATTAGAPNSCVLGAGGEMYVCQNGGTVGPWRAAEMLPPSIQVVARRGGPAEIIATEIEGIGLRGPNDLVFGPDGSLYFTDPGIYNVAHPDPSYIFALGPDGSGSVVVEFPTPTFPNGLAFDQNGDLVWVESYTGHLRRRRLDGSGIEELGRLPGSGPVPDGMGVGADGRLYITDIESQGLHVAGADGAVEEFIAVGTNPTNCAFDDDGSLIVTDAGRLANNAEPSLNGTLWRVALGRAGQAVQLGRIGSR